MGGTRQNFGLSARLQVGSIDVILISHNGQLLDLAQLTSIGVDVARKDLIVCKSKYSYYAFISPSPFPLFLPLSLYLSFSPSLFLYLPLSLSPLSSLQLLIIVQSSSHHFRACLGPLVGGESSPDIITVDGGGLGSMVLKLSAPYRNVRRPIWPLDPLES
jgi:microcystin degradation protein MlrC